MLMLTLNVVYVLVAIAMIALILMQRGAGAQAGSGFGGGASATVFGSRGASNFLSKSTKWLAIAFFAISLGMAVYASKTARQGGLSEAKPDLGVMAQQPVPAAQVKQVPAAQVPAASTQQPAAPVSAPQYGQQPAAAAPAVEQPVPEPAPAK